MRSSAPNKRSCNCNLHISHDAPLWEMCCVCCINVVKAYRRRRLLFVVQESQYCAVIATIPAVFLKY